MTQPLVGVDHHGPVAVVRLNRPERRNAMNAEMGRDFVATLNRLDADPVTRAIVVTGEGPAFCAGADLAVLAQGPSALESFVDDPALRALAIAPMLLSTPVATAVKGAAAGAGFVLAISADACFIDRTARFIPVFPQLGLVAEYASAWLLPRRVGSLRASDMLLRGQQADAEAAIAWGLAQECVDDPVARAVEWAGEVSACSPYAVATAKRQLRESATMTFAQAHEASVDLMRMSFTRPDLAEALLAKSQGRDPQFAPYPG